METIGKGLTTALDHYQDQILQSYRVLLLAFFGWGSSLKLKNNRKISVIAVLCLQLERRTYVQRFEYLAITFRYRCPITSKNLVLITKTRPKS